MRITVVGGAGMVGSRVAMRTCQEHGADWVYLSPAAILEPGRRTGNYQHDTTTLIANADGISRISAEDLAVAVLDEIENPNDDRHFTVGY